MGLFLGRISEMRPPSGSSILRVLISRCSWQWNKEAGSREPKKEDCREVHLQGKPDPMELWGQSALLSLGRVFRTILRWIIC